MSIRIFNILSFVKRINTIFIAYFENSNLNKQNEKDVLYLNLIHNRFNELQGQQ